MSSADREMLVETVDRAFADLAERERENEDKADAAHFAEMWAAVEDIGIGSLLVPEDADGFGGSYEDLCAVLRCAGYYGIALPIGETILMRGLLSGGALKLDPAMVTAAAMAHALPFGAMSFADREPRTAPWRPETQENADEAHAQSVVLSVSSRGSMHFTGTLASAPWGRAVEHVVREWYTANTRTLVCLSVADAKPVRAGLSTTNIAGEPRDTLEFEEAAVQLSTLYSGPPLHTLGALLRLGQMAGALDRVLQSCLDHAASRSQFGKTLGQFQAIQHQIAVLAEECAAVSCAAQAAFRAADLGDAGLEIAAGKLRANRAAGIATAIAHQVHGAIGFTHEHDLHHATRRLWSWRSEYGNDRYWALHLGRHVARIGADHLWPWLTERSDRTAIRS